MMTGITPGLGRVTLRLQVASQSEGGGLGSALTHPLSLSDANTARVAVPTGLRDSNAILLPHIDTWGLGNPEYRRVATACGTLVTATA